MVVAYNEDIDVIKVQLCEGELAESDLDSWNPLDVERNEPPESMHGPGRFDRHVVLELPDRSDRIAILKVHTRKVPLADDIELDKISAGTPGFSGADIKNLVTEAAMLAARDDAA